MASFGNGIGGATAGALYGSGIGGPIGGLIGGGVGLLGGLFGSRKSKPSTLSTLDPKQRQLLDKYIQALEGGGGPLGDLFGQQDPAQLRSLFENSYAKPAYQNFSRNIAPTIMGQFRSKGLGDSSYAAGALADAGTNVQQGLDSQLANLLYNAQQSQLDRRGRGVSDVLGMGTFDYKQRQPDIFENLINSLAGGAGKLLADRFTGG